jgi:hypothetical protein
MQQDNKTINDKSHFELKEWGGQLYPLVKRKKGTSKIDECPFCNQRHTHGLGNGHRIPHCTEEYDKAISIDGNNYLQGRGYFIEEY